MLALTNCGGGPRALVAGTDSCEYCRMTVSDVRFGAEVVARTGRVHTFDSIECAAAWILSAPQASANRGIWVADYGSGSLIPADSALFVEGGTLRSPMGRGIVAFPASVGAETLAARYGGRILRWIEVTDAIRTRGIPGAISSPAPVS